MSHLTLSDRIKIEMCLNAGMNGHIAKPVDIKLVIKEIRRIKEEKRS